MTTSILFIKNGGIAAAATLVLHLAHTFCYVLVVWTDPVVAADTSVCNPVCMSESQVQWPISDLVIVCVLSASRGLSTPCIRVQLGVATKFVCVFEWCAAAAV